MSLFRQALRSVLTKESVWGDVSKSPNNAAFGLSYGNFGSMSFAGVSITPETAVSFSAVFACIRLISDTIAAMPLDVLQKYPNGRYTRTTPEFLVRPNPEMTWPEFVQQLVAARLIDGNAYFIPVTKGGRCIEMWPVDPSVVDVVRDNAGNLVYVIRKKQQVTAKEIVHIRGLTLPGYLKGLSPIECARHTIGLALSAEKHGSQLFGMGANFDTVIKVKTKLTREQAKMLASGFVRDHSGDNAYAPVVVDQDADVQKMSMTMEEAQFLTTRQFQVEEICRWYGVPPHRIAMTEKTTSWGTGIEQQNIAFLQDAIAPDLVRLETALNPYVRYENPDYYVKFNVSGLLRADMAARKDYYKAMWEVGAYSPDDILALEDMNPLPGGAGQNHYVPMNYVPIGAMPGGVQ